jgi:hypothetical protein
MSDDTKPSKIKKSKKIEPSTTKAGAGTTTNNLEIESGKPPKLKLSQLSKLKEVGETAGTRPELNKSAKKSETLEPKQGDCAAINSFEVLGTHPGLDELAGLVSDDSLSLLSHTYNPNNNTFILDYVIRRLTDQGIDGSTSGGVGLDSLRLFTINWDIMMSKCPAKSMLRPSERPDYQYPIYEFPADALPEGQQGYLIDFQKMRYKTYPIILALIEYLVSTRSFIARRRKILIIAYHMELCLTGYYYKFAQLIERYSDSHYYWMLHGGTETPNLLRHKFMSMVQYYPVRLDLPSLVPGANQATELTQIIWDLTDRDILKTWLLAENIHTPDELIRALPLCQILTEYIRGLKAIKHMNDVTACYRVAYKINTLGYSIARLGRTLTAVLKWHRQTRKTLKFAPEFAELAADRNWPRVVKMFADYEVGKYCDRTEQIPIFQNLMIDLARIQFGG